VKKPDLAVDQILELAARYERESKPKDWALKNQILAAWQRVKNDLDFAMDNLYLISGDWRNSSPLFAPTRVRIYQNPQEKVRRTMRNALAALPFSDYEAILILTGLNGVAVRTALTNLHFATDPMELLPPALPILDVNLLEARDEKDRTADDPLWDLRIWPEFRRSMIHLSLELGLPMRIVDRALFIYGEDLRNQRRHGLRQ
jgi:hypothetical protein